MRLLFVTFWNFDDEAVNGIAKKIRAQQRAFEAFGFDVDFCYARDGMYYREQNGVPKALCRTRRYTTRIAAANALSRTLTRENARYDCAYIRYALADGGLVSLVRTLKKGGTRVAVEIPTFPYEKEFHSGLLRLSLAVDRAYRLKAARHVDRFVIVTDRETAFGVPTIRTFNGVDPEKLRLSESVPAADGTIRLIAVAGFAPWHGYDRLLCGLAAYKKAGGKRRFTIDFVGDGPALPGYRTLCAQLSLERDVTFSGFLGGAALDDAFNRADIAVETLARFRTEGCINSSLKFYEYLARGLPAVSTGRLSIHPSLLPYTLEVSNDESPIDFAAVARFYDDVCSGDADKLHAAVRAAALPLCSVERMMRPVADYFEGEREK